MKNTAIILLSLIVSFLSYERVNRKPIKTVLIPKTVFTISKTTMQIVTSINSPNDTITKLHVVSLGEGLTKYSLRTNEEQRVEFKIWNY